MSGCAGITKGRPRGGGICRWELEGLHALLDALVGWLGRTRRGATTNIPAGIPNPSGDVAALPTTGLSTRRLARPSYCPWQPQPRAESRCLEDQSHERQFLARTDINSSFCRCRL